MTKLRRNIPLTAERVRELLDYDPATGALTVAKKRRRSHKQGGALGSPLPKTGYVVLHVDGNRYYAHRIIWLWMTGEWPAQLIDHRDRDRGNNRWRNLRQVTPTENARNRKASNSSGILGVYHTRQGSWRASICADGRRYHLGTFDSLGDAVQAREDAERRYWGTDAQTGEVRYAA